ncbi:sensor histidine kinase [Sphingomonas sp.]|uniref:sensor histidine kinase n=1 Tax=Sphingomonas sp. TaxID=28214 RepID=UPI003B00984C
MAATAPIPGAPPGTTPPPSVARAFARLSTSIKMLIILTLALLPLGVISSLASIEASRAAHRNRVLAAQLLAGNSADRLSLFVDRSAAALRGLHGRGASGCRHAADVLEVQRVSVAMFDAAGRTICHTVGFEASPPAMLALDAPPLVALTANGDALLVETAAAGGMAMAEIPRRALTQASHPNAVDGSYDLRLIAPDGATLRLAAMRAVVIGRDIATVAPVAGGQLRLAMTIESAPLGATEILLVILPMLMWVAGAAIGWLVVDRLLIRPLGQLERAIDHSRTRGGRLVVPVSTTPAHEIRSLGDALIAASATIARHETELEDGLARQTKLTREVHHRVKNNLQVIASLLNIHARGATTPEATAAYAAIQRRVDALALVHRSHYAELEVNRGLALRPLVGELCANLRGSAGRDVRAPSILLDVEPAQVNQDVAVSVAFLITELLELAMMRAAGAVVTIALHAEQEGQRARLSVTSSALRQDAAPVDEVFERGERIVTGLARQLRSPLDRDDERGAVTIVFPILPLDPSRT